MENPKIVALAGNPNVGKSTVFNALTGLRQHTGNWSGKTVSNAKGFFTYDAQQYILVDLPGCYSLASHVAEESAARDFICSGEADVVVVVCDATCLERNLNLALQVMEMTSNVIICVNLMDEARKKGIFIDLQTLSERLGLPVIGTAARGGCGLDDLIAEIGRMAETPREKIKGLRTLVADSEVTEDVNLPSGSEDKVLKMVEMAENIAQEVIHTQERVGQELGSKIDDLLSGKWTAFPLMLLGLLGIFWITITGSNYPSQFLNTVLFQFEEPLLSFCVWIKMPQFIAELLVLGVYRVLAWVVSVMLPPMAIFFPLFTLLEDAGVLPRVAFNLDRCFKKCHACGKQALTMAMGFGCNAVGVTGCRIIDSPRERLIAIITNSFVPCNGRFPMLIAILTMFFVGATAGFYASFFSALFLTGLIVLSIVMTFAASWILSKTILRGQPSSFILELPPYRKPQIGKVIVRSLLDRTIFVLGRAVKAAAPAGLIIFVLANVSVGEATLLAYCAEFLDPFGQALGMDGVILLAFILGLPANEIVVPIMIMTYMATGNLMELETLFALKLLLVDNGWTWITAVSVLLFALMHWPCATTLLTIYKETHGLKWVAVSFLTPAIAGIITCFVFANIARLMVGIFCV